MQLRPPAQAGRRNEVVPRARHRSSSTGDGGFFVPIFWAQMDRFLTTGVSAPSGKPAADFGDHR